MNAKKAKAARRIARALSADLPSRNFKIKKHRPRIEIINGRKQRRQTVSVELGPCARRAYKDIKKATDQ